MGYGEVFRERTRAHMIVSTQKNNRLENLERRVKSAAF